MEPEDQIPQDNEQQDGESSSNTFPGQDQNFNNRVGLKDVQGLASKFKGAKKTGRIGQTAQKARAAAQAASATTRAAAQAATRAIAQAAARAAASAIIASVGWEVILAIIIIIVLITVLSGDNSSISSNQSLASSGPVFAKIGDKLDYTITVDYPGTARDIIITDQIPDGTEYVNAPQATYDPSTNTVTWNIPATTSASLSLTLLATKDNDYIVNILKGTMPNGVLGKSDSMITPTLFQAAPNEVFGENNSQLLAPRSPAEALAERDEVGSTLTVTPTLFQKAPTNTPISPSDKNIIKSCVVTKVGEPAVIPSLPPECAEF